MSGSQVDTDEIKSLVPSRKNHDKSAEERSATDEITTGTLPVNGRYARIELPEDFLRIPQHQALKIFNINNGCFEWKVVKDLEDHVIHMHLNHNLAFSNMVESCERLGSAILFRQMGTEIGIQLKVSEGYFFIHSLKLLDGRRIHSIDSYNSVIHSGPPYNNVGPAFLSGLKPGDRILGLNGISFLDVNVDTNQKGIEYSQSIRSLELAVKYMTKTKGPLVFHIMRNLNCPFLAKSDEKNTVVSDVSNQVDLIKDERIRNESSCHGISEPYRIHSIISLCHQRGLIKSKKEESQLSRDLVAFHSRARLWETNFYLDNNYFACSYYMAPRGIKNIRQAVCVHVVNTFIENNCIVFTLWVQDVESNATWYAFKHYQDFLDLRQATVLVDRSVQNLPFPDIHRWLGQETSMPTDKHQSHEFIFSEFLQGLCNHFYLCRDLSVAVEISPYVQTFLGCSDIDFERNIELNYGVTIDCISERSRKTRINWLHLIRLHTFRVLLLSPLQELVTRFITDIKARIQILEAQKSVTLSGKRFKEKVLYELSFMSNVLSSLVDLVFQGCHHDFQLIFSSQDFFQDTYTRDQFDNLCKIAVREQTESIVFIPLRRTISSLVIYAWRYDDKKIENKISHLRFQDQSYFKIKHENQSPSKWLKVVDILSSGLGKSALPCQKLHSLVHASQEISRLLADEHPSTARNSLGADEILPIFIYCFVNSEIDKPCALCALLRQLLDSSQQIGEIGYYMSSYEAILEYIHELDLS